MDILPVLKKSSMVVALTNHKEVSSDLIAELVLRGFVNVLDGGNRFPAYHIAQLIRGRSLQLDAISGRIFVRRAFTCYQMVNLLESAATSGYPHLILDLLATFQDDQIKPSEANRLLNLCLSHIERLRCFAPVAVIVEPVILAKKEFLLKRVCEQADKVFTFHTETSPQIVQLPLFQGM